MEADTAVVNCFFRRYRAWAGFRSNIVRFPSERLTVIVLSNLKLLKVAEAAETVSGYYLMGTE